MEFDEAVTSSGLLTIVLMIVLAPLKDSSFVEETSHSGARRRDDVTSSDVETLSGNAVTPFVVGAERKALSSEDDDVTSLGDVITPFGDILVFDIATSAACCGMASLKVTFCVTLVLQICPVLMSAMILRRNVCLADGKRLSCRRWTYETSLEFSCLVKMMQIEEIKGLLESLNKPRFFFCIRDPFNLGQKII